MKYVELVVKDAFCEAEKVTKYIYCEGGYTMDNYKISTFD